MSPIKLHPKERPYKASWWCPNSRLQLLLNFWMCPWLLWCLAVSILQICAIVTCFLFPNMKKKQHFLDRAITSELYVLCWVYSFSFKTCFKNLVKSLENCEETEEDYFECNHDQLVAVSHTMSKFSDFRSSETHLINVVVSTSVSAFTKSKYKVLQGIS